MTDLIKHLREIAGYPSADAPKIVAEAADALEAANERIAALTVKCGLLAASLDKADLETEALAGRAERNEVDAERYRWLKERVEHDDRDGYFTLPQVFAWDIKPGPELNEPFPDFDSAIDAALSATKEQG